MAKAPTTSKGQALSKANQIVPYLTLEEVSKLAEAARNGRKGERDQLLILTLFQTGLRVSEAISLAPRHIGQYEASQ